MGDSNYQIRHDRPNCIGCLTPETVVVGPFGAKQVKDVCVGDNVLTSSGSFEPVTGTTVHNHDGVVYDFKVRSLGVISLTEEHPVLCVRKNQSGTSNPIMFEWVEASHLNEGDFTVFPISSGFKERNVFLPVLSSVSSGKYGMVQLEKLVANYSEPFALFPIMQITQRQYSGPVYNLEVKSKGDYCTSAGIVHNCAACASISPDYWSMGDDGKSDVKGASKTPEGWEELDIPDSSYEDNKRAAESCPVNVIHIVDKKTGKQII